MAKASWSLGSFGKREKKSRRWYSRRDDGLVPLRRFRSTAQFGRNAQRGSPENFLLTPFPVFATSHPVSRNPGAIMQPASAKAIPDAALPDDPPLRRLWQAPV